MIEYYKNRIYPNLNSQDFKSLTLDLDFDINTDKISNYIFNRFKYLEHALKNL